jgi:hypothetical protein
VVPEIDDKTTPPGFVGIEKVTAVLCDAEPVLVKTLKVSTESVGAPDPET